MQRNVLMGIHVLWIQTILWLTKYVRKLSDTIPEDKQEKTKQMWIFSNEYLARDCALSWWWNSRFHLSRWRSIFLQRSVQQKVKLRLYLKLNTGRTKIYGLLETLNQVKERPCCMNVMGSLLILMLADFKKIHLCQGSPEHKYRLDGSGLKQSWGEGLGGAGWWVAQQDPSMCTCWSITPVETRWESWDCLVLKVETFQYLKVLQESWWDF